MEHTRLQDERTPDNEGYPPDTSANQEARRALVLPGTFLDQEAVRDTLVWAGLREGDPKAAEAVKQQMQIRLAAVTGEIAGRVDTALQPLGNTPHRAFRPKSPESTLAKVRRRGDDLRPLSDLSGGILVVRQERGKTEEDGKQIARNTLLYLQGYFGVPNIHADGSPTIEEGVASWSKTGFVRRVAKLWAGVDGRAELFEIQAYTAEEYRDYMRTWKRYEAGRPGAPSVAELGNLALLYS